MSLNDFDTPTERLDRRRDFDPLVGRVLDSKYQIVSRLGEGGMGAVYLARRLHIGDEVVVKILLKQYVADAAAIERFRREARAAALLRHPNVVGIYDFGEARGEDAPAYIVMELVEGISLRDLIRREGRLAPARVISLMRDICAGVGAAHRRNIVHRDLKPDNIIVLPPPDAGERETVKVLDFGIAKLRDVQTALSLTEAGSVMGTPYYMSPEQCSGEPLDPRSDVYSLGVMLYEMLTGVPPFNGPNIASLITKHLTEAPPSISLQLGVSTALDAVYQRALAKDKNLRQADATALSRELQTAQEDTGSVFPAPHTPAPRPPQTAQVWGTTMESAPTITQREQPAGKSRRAWWVAGGVVVLIVCAVLVGFALRLFPGGKTPGTNVSTGGDSAAEAQQSSTETGPVGSNEDRSGDSRSDELKMKGKWAGTTGPSNQAAVLMINSSRGSTFEGVLEQGEFRIAVNGSVNTGTRRVTIQETRVLKGGGWSLGKGTGEISADGRTMSGTGSDEMGGQFGITYNWSFSKQ